jgi:hypothetical protein
MRKKFEGEQWVNLYDHALAWFDEKDFDFAAINARRTAVRNIRANSVLDFLEDNCQTNLLEAHSGVRTAMDLVTRAREDTTPSIDPMLALAESLGKEVDLGDTVDALQDELDLVIEDLNAAYPMLEMLSQSNVIYNDNVVDKVTEYVIMCDNVSETNHQMPLVA